MGGGPRGAELRRIDATSVRVSSRRPRYIPLTPPPSPTLRHVVGALDVGGMLHPPNKMAVGERLGLAAMRHVYQWPAPHPVASPRFKEANIEGSSIVLSFTSVGPRGLTTSDNKPPRGFALCCRGPTTQKKKKGNDPSDATAEWVWAAAAKVSGLGEESVVVLSHPGIGAPKYVRYAYLDDTSTSNVVALGTRLPLLPFRNDDFEMERAVGAAADEPLEAGGDPMAFGPGSGLSTKK